MEAITLPVYNSEGKEIESVKLDQAVFSGQVHKASLHQAISAYLANSRMGLAATKTRGEVSGGGRKPWKQKGTGRARVGSTRSPLWRHGGVVFGPHPRDFSLRLPAKIKNLALKSALNAKVIESNLVVLDGITLEKIKTKEAFKIISNLKLGGLKAKKDGVLLVFENSDANIKRAFSNIGLLKLSVSSDVNAYDVLACVKMVITKNALLNLVKRLKK